MKILLLSLITATLSFGAVNAGMQWDVRTTGSDNNGGGFDSTVASPGTDFSQQNSAQVAYTDLVIGGTTTQLTSALSPFGATAPGNVIKITGGAGCTTGWYEVLSVSGVTATMDRAVGTTASICTGNLGGSLATPFAGTTSQPVASGNTIWVKAGTYTFSSGASCNTNTVAMCFGTIAGASSLNVTGYNATHNDNGTKPLFTTATDNLWMIGLNGGTVWRFKNLQMTSTASTRVAAFFSPTNAVTTGALVVIDCILDGFKWGINGDNGSSRQIFGVVLLSNTEIKNSQTNAIINQGNIFLYNETWIHNTGGDAVSLIGSASFVCSRSILSANSGKGFTAATVSLQLSSCVGSGNTGDAISTSAGSNVYVMVNCIFYNNGGWGVNIGGSPFPVMLARNNAFGSNVSGNVNITYIPYSDQTLTASPFVSTSDFALNNTAGGGALLRKAGFGGVSVAGTGYLDIGAIQTSGGTGGGQTASAYAQ